MAATQVGTELKIGFSGDDGATYQYAYTGYVMESFDVEAQDKNVEEIMDADGATMTIILHDPAEQISFTAVILDGGSLSPFVIGASFSIETDAGPPAVYDVYRVLSSSVAQTAGASRLTLTAIKEASMTYTTEIV